MADDTTDADGTGPDDPTPTTVRGRLAVFAKLVGIGAAAGVGVVVARHLATGAPTRIDRYRRGEPAPEPPVRVDVTTNRTGGTVGTGTGSLGSTTGEVIDAEWTEGAPEPVESPAKVARERERNPFTPPPRR